jgi:hypothetical protein
MDGNIRVWPIDANDTWGQSMNDITDRARELATKIYMNKPPEIDVDKELVPQYTTLLAAALQRERDEATPDGVLAEVAAERARQDARWGVQNHKPEAWLSILGEEFGEVCRAVCERLYAVGPNPEYRLELIQTAAVAVAMVQCYDRAAIQSYQPKDARDETGGEGERK